MIWNSAQQNHQEGTYHQAKRTRYIISDELNRRRAFKGIKSGKRCHNKIAPKIHEVLSIQGN